MPAANRRMCEILSLPKGDDSLDTNPFLGVFFHALGGFAAASFYIPFARVRKWRWESYWIIGGIFSWLIAPWVAALIKVPDPIAILRESPWESLGYTFLYGILWGIGGLMFGLSVRYLGLSLGYALALGFCAAFGTIIPPIYYGKIIEMAGSKYGAVSFAGIAVCLMGIAICGLAGMNKERELTDHEKKASISEFNFRKGIWIAILCGIMSACMAFGIASGKPISAIALEHHTPTLWQNTMTFVVIFSGGLLTNLVWCVFLNLRNASGNDYLDRESPLLGNYFFAGLAGVIWYLQFMFYGMGETQMSANLKFTSWTLHMAFIIVFSNFWAILFREWRGTSSKTHRLILSGILTLILSTIIVGIGNKLAP
jgi:L-rhamnose-H+ transport protein